MRDFLKRWSGARGGAAAMIFAIGGVVMVMCVGAGVDLSRQAYLRSRMSDAVDAAALGLIGKTSPEYIAASSMTNDGAIPGAQTAAASVFNATMKDQIDYTLTNFTVLAQKTGRQVTATVTATATIPTYFMGMVGSKTMTVTSRSAVENDLPTYIDFYLLLDNTPSMGMGSSAADMTKLSDNNGGCAFACHIEGSTNDAYTLARSLNISMRIDSVRTATQQLMTTAGATETLPNQFRMAIATFGATAEHAGYTPIVPQFPATDPTADLNGAKSAASAIDLMQQPYQGYNDDRDTSYLGAMTGANLAIPTPGDGSAATKPQKVLFLVTDGVNDGPSFGPCVNGVNPDGDMSRCLSPMAPTQCDALKTRGVRIAVLYTTYLPSDGWYWGHVSPFQDQIAPGLQACASPGLFFEVNPATSGITDAMTALFVKAVQSARIVS